jgi:4-aminobutyrate aminotransferase-like enzyme
VESGHGAYVHDATGRRYLDAVAGYGVASLGHSHPHWVEAVIAQAGRLTVSPLHTDQLGRYLEALSDTLVADLGRIALCSTGAEAVEMAIRLAQTAGGRPGVLTFRDGFHGKTAAVRYTRDPDAPEARELAPPWLRTADYPACRHDPLAYPSCADRGADVLEAVRARGDLHDVGAVLIEPVLGTAGNIPPQQGFLPALRTLCDDRGWLLVFDESITGLGRTGEMFALERFGARPDVLVLGKGLGGGFPLSAVCASGELWAASALSSPSSTSSSYGGNPLACAAGLATLDVLGERGFLSGVRASGDRIAAGLCELATASESVSWPRGVGLMLGFDHVDPATGALAAQPACEERFRECRDRGLLVAAHSPRVRVNPPLTIGAREAGELLDTLFEVFA